MVLSFESNCSHTHSCIRTTKWSAKVTDLCHNHDDNNFQSPLSLSLCFIIIHDSEISRDKSVLSLVPRLSTWRCPLWARTEGSPYSITERRVPELIPVLGSQPAGDMSHKPGGRLPLLSARPAVTPATLKRAATNFAAWRTEARWVWTVCLRLLPDSVTAAIWTGVLLRLSPTR